MVGSTTNIVCNQIAGWLADWRGELSRGWVDEAKDWLKSYWLESEHEQLGWLWWEQQQKRRKVLKKQKRFECSWSCLWLILFVCRLWFFKFGAAEDGFQWVQRRSGKQKGRSEKQLVKKRVRNRANARGRSLGEGRRTKTASFNSDNCFIILKTTTRSGSLVLMIG